MRWPNGSISPEAYLSMARVHRLVNTSRRVHEHEGAPWGSGREALHRGQAHGGDLQPRQLPQGWVHQLERDPARVAKHAKCIHERLQVEIAVAGEDAVA